MLMVYKVSIWISHTTVQPFMVEKGPEQQVTRATSEYISSDLVHTAADSTFPTTVTQE